MSSRPRHKPSTASPRYRRRLMQAAACVLSLGAVLYAGLWWLAVTASVSTHGETDQGKGNVAVPVLRDPVRRTRSALIDSLIASWADRDFLDWQVEGKVLMPRILLAKLAANKDVSEVNDYLLATRVRGSVGSTSLFHPEGDYDFTLAGLCLLLFSFGDSPDRLYPQTTAHIVHELMTESGGTPVEFTPRLLGLPLRDTENHILMTEGSRYLKNQWLRLHGSDNPIHDNQANGLEAFLLAHLQRMQRAGFHEYNSRPYIGYTLTALLNLQSFADAPVRVAATELLDRANWEYALGSLRFRRFPPFRRQPERADDNDLDGDYHTAMIKAWMSLQQTPQTQDQLSSGGHHALWVAFTTYRLPRATVRWLVHKPQEYFVRIGHGADGSPELYSGGPGYLITAGGVARDRFRQSVARPTTLMLHDGALDVSQVLQVTGDGDDYRQWNNTGVHQRFAVGRRLTVPASWQPIAQDFGWSIYHRGGLWIVTYRSERVGLFYLIPDLPQTDRKAATNAVRARATLLHLQKLNPSTALLNRFQGIDRRTIYYDVEANVDQWVVQKTSESNVERNFSRWPLLQDQQSVSTTTTVQSGKPNES